MRQKGSATKPAVPGAVASIKCYRFVRIEIEAFLVTVDNIIVLSVLCYWMTPTTNSPTVT